MHPLLLFLLVIGLAIAIFMTITAIQAIGREHRKREHEHAPERYSFDDFIKQIEEHGIEYPPFRPFVFYDDRHRRVEIHLAQEAYFAIWLGNTPDGEVTLYIGEESGDIVGGAFHIPKDKQDEYLSGHGYIKCWGGEREEFDD